MNTFTRAVLLRPDGNREPIALPATFPMLLALLGSPPPLSSAAFMFGVRACVMVYVANCGPDQRAVNTQASVLHPKRIEIRGTAVILIGEQIVTAEDEITKSTDDLKRNFAEMLGEVRFGKKRVIITSRGKEAGAIVSMDDLEFLRQHKSKGKAA